MRKLVLGTSIILSACGPSGRDGNSVQPDAPPSSDTDAPPQANMSRVYAHSGSTLYRLDTATLSPQMIGTMSGLGTSSLTDLAIDKDDTMVGITLRKLYSIDSTTGAATLITDLSDAAQGENFTSLSFVPQDLNDPNSADILVAASSKGEVYAIDKSSGDATMLGDFGTVGSDEIGSSGDLIGVRGLGIYATVNVGTDPAGQDYLARIDPVTWEATVIGDGTGFNDIFGLGYWQGQIYGFVSEDSDSGKIVTIDPTTGAGTEIQTSAVRWYGAGVATDAPIIQ
jgi:hypothetical protein